MASRIRDTSHEERRTRALAGLAVVCLGLSSACGITYNLNVSVLSDGTLYEPSYLVPVCEGLFVASLVAGGIALHRWWNGK